MNDIKENKNNSLSFEHTITVPKAPFSVAKMAEVAEGITDTGSYLDTLETISKQDTEQRQSIATNIVAKYGQSKDTEDKILSVYKAYVLGCGEKDSNAYTCDMAFEVAFRKYHASRVGKTSKALAALMLRGIVSPAYNSFYVVSYGSRVLLVNDMYNENAGINRGGLDEVIDVTDSLYTVLKETYGLHLVDFKDYYKELRDTAGEQGADKTLSDMIAKVLWSYNGGGSVAEVKHLKTAQDIAEETTK